MLTYISQLHEDMILQITKKNMELLRTETAKKKKTYFSCVKI